MNLKGTKSYVLLATLLVAISLLSFFFWPKKKVLVNVKLTGTLAEDGFEWLARESACFDELLLQGGKCFFLDDHENLVIKDIGYLNTVSRLGREYDVELFHFEMVRLPFEKLRNSTDIRSSEVAEEIKALADELEAAYEKKRKDVEVMMQFLKQNEETYDFVLEIERKLVEREKKTDITDPMGLNSPTVIDIVEKWTIFNAKNKANRKEWKTDYVIFHDRYSVYDKWRDIDTFRECLGPAVIPILNEVIEFIR